jgi:hypothetical protein
MSLTTLVLLVAGAAIVIALVTKASKAKLEQRKIDRYMAALNEWGYAAGRLGKPPDFYKSERPEKEFDFADEAAMLVGWQAGFDEYLATHGGKTADAPPTERR